MAALAVGAILSVTVAGAVYAEAHWAALGAQGSDVLRSLLGDRAVSRLETILFQTQDAIRGWEYSMQAQQARAPWQATIAEQQSGRIVHPSSAAPGVNIAHRAARLPPAPEGWQPAPAEPLGQLKGVGQWSSYLEDSSGTTVGYRTFFQPDANRPYVVGAVVAIDLRKTRLHLVIGTEEPASPVTIRRTGAIPSADRRPDILLAAFNGGFKARHGHFGVMANGSLLLPPRLAMGTVVLYSDGRVRIDQWGQFPLTSGIIAWRQNGPLIVDRGKINPQTDVVSPDLWGTYLTGNTVTWRSGLGISQDGRTLYYAAGPSLTVDSLAKMLIAAGASEAVQLDINNYWVQFDAVHTSGTQLRDTPLLPEMRDNPDRFLGQYARDFFYVTDQS
jgi:Phosphodiester glycosidase